MTHKIQPRQPFEDKAQEKAFSHFIHTWTEDPSGAKKVFLELTDSLLSKDGIKVVFIERPKITYSLRASNSSRNTQRPLCAMLDVIDDDPGNRWLSICFYGDMINDPDGKGDLIPGGLLGEDGYCFDINGYSQDMIAYARQRIDEACSNPVE